MRIWHMVCRYKLQTCVDNKIHIDQCVLVTLLVYELVFIHIICFFVQIFTALVRYMRNERFQVGDTSLQMFDILPDMD